MSCPNQIIMNFNFFQYQQKKDWVVLHQISDERIKPIGGIFKQPF